MKKNILFLLAFPLLLLLMADLSYAQDTVGSFSDDPSVYQETLEENELLSIEVSKSELELVVLGTLTSGKSTKALIKNPITGEIGKYLPGDRLDLIKSEYIQVLEIANCMILIDRSGTHETLECNNKMPTVVFNRASLAKYKINRPESGVDLSNGFVTEYDRDIILISEKHKVDPYLVKAVIKAESNFDPDAVSPKNAQGIMQLIPATASDYGVNDPFDAKENMEGGVEYLKDLLDYFDGDLKLSLAAYNAGKGSVIKHGFTIPPYPETTDYIAKVLEYYKHLKAENYSAKR
ncbi:MAG: lytic transglycosylase domain-containing protein [Thermodesulfobacteriota bacterium]